MSGACVACSEGGDAVNVFQKLKLVFSNSFDEQIQKFLLGEETVVIPGTGSIDSTTAMKYTAVFACVRVLAETFATPPAKLYRRINEAERESRNDLAIYDILHNRPNEEMSPFNFKEAAMVALNTGGNAVCERLVTRRGKLVGLYPYRWQNVKIDRDPDTQRLRYNIYDGRGLQPAKQLSRDQIFHVPGLSFDGVIGLSPIEYATSAIRLGRNYEDFGNAMFKNSAIPSGAFSTTGALNDASFERLKKELKSNYTGMRNHGVPMLLEGGLEFKPFTVKPIDAQLIENKKFQIEDIARVYRVPLHLIQNLDRATNNNIEHQSLEFVMYTMLPWFKRWEENVNMQLLTPAERRAGYYVEFDLRGLLRGDQQSRSRAYALGRQWGWLSVNDIRKLENMPPIANGDIYLEPANMREAGSDERRVENLATEIYKMISEGGAS
jgi:HK97 family phage portal protein